MTWNGKIGNDLVVAGQAKPQPPSAYKIVGQSPPRFDVPAKVFGKLDYVTDIKVPGMLHGRMIRAPVSGALPVAVDDGSAHDLPGVRVIRDKGFIRSRTDGGHGMAKTSRRCGSALRHGSATSKTRWRSARARKQG
jgi:CO/xanthine dehydrogenase Mo-binding subunit